MGIIERLTSALTEFYEDHDDTVYILPERELDLGELNYREGFRMIQPDKAEHDRAGTSTDPPQSDR